MPAAPMANSFSSTARTKTDADVGCPVALRVVTVTVTRSPGW